MKIELIVAATVLGVLAIVGGVIAFVLKKDPMNPLWYTLPRLDFPERNQWPSAADSETLSLENTRLTEIQFK